MAKTFRGGVHPYEGKELTEDKPVVPYEPKGLMVYPLSQHIGAPAVPCVNKGDRVLRGQKIAEAGGFVSAAIFSSVSGTVQSIAPHRVANGDMVSSIIIQNDGLYEEVIFDVAADPYTLSEEEIIGKIKDAGIVGMGGAGFPTHVKLSPKEPAKIDHIIANCSECEPYLTSDYRQMIDDPGSLVEGMKLILTVFRKAKGVFAIEDNKPAAIEAVSELIKGERRMEICVLKTKYPQGGERQLIKAVTGREVNSKMLPADAGCIVDNVATLVAVFNAVKYGRPIMNRLFTVSGDAIEDPKNYLVYTGTSMKELLEEAGNDPEKTAKYISGGPMMGFAMFDTDVPITKTNSSILAFTEDEVSKNKTTACINCGKCVEVCPERLVPSRLAKMADHGDAAGFEKWYGLECIECGSCSFICPAKRPLAQSIRIMKRSVLAAKRKK